MSRNRGSVISQCKYCNKTFRYSPSENRKFCTVECFKRYKLEKAKDSYETVECKQCKKIFTVRKDFHQKFCSRKCFKDYLSLSKRVYLKCAYCKKTFHVPQCKSHRKYCSMECRNKHYSIIRRGKNSYTYNPNITDEERTNRRSSLLQHTWAFKVKKRDNFTCQRCGNCRGGNLVSHHILAYWKYPKERLKMSNGITLCEDCHNLFHRVYGVKVFTDIDFYEFMRTR